MNAKKRKTISILGIIAGIFVALILWTLWGNTALQLNSYAVASRRLPDSFDGYRIAQVSDLHNAEMGEDNIKLLNMLREAQPDMIAITGDLIDSYDTDLEIALKFAEEAVKIAPCYYVTGNHEARISAYPQFQEKLLEMGVVVLEDERLELERSGERIVLLGVNDPSFQTGYLFGDAETVMADTLSELMKDDDLFTLLLSHRPELFEVYVDQGVDLTLSGHAHGGQFRLPFVGGIIAPNQGFFPEYDAGLFVKDTTSMIVSRGIGNSLFPLRFNNRPEVVLIQLLVS